MFRYTHGSALLRDKVLRLVPTHRLTTEFASADIVYPNHFSGPEDPFCTLAKMVSVSMYVWDSHKETFKNGKAGAQSQKCDAHADAASLHSVMSAASVPSDEYLAELGTSLPMGVESRASVSIV